MPYRNKEDRTEAVRRHRERKGENKERAEKVKEIEASLGRFLRSLGFEEISFELLVEICKDSTKDDDGVWHDRRTGKVTYPPSQVFFGLNTMIAGNHLDDQVNALATVFQDWLDYDENYRLES